MRQKAVILHVEDDADSRVLVRNFLEFYGYQVVQAINGDEAFAAAVQERPDLILVDIKLPRIPGIEETRQIKTTAQLRGIPVIAVTSLASPGTGYREAIAAGCDAYLGKPYRPSQLLQLIQRFLASER
jgi:two-component system cell cycle response regulator DivK